MILFLILSVLLYLTNAQMAEMERLQQDLSRFLSIPRFNDTEKLLARNAIQTSFDAMGLSSFTHSFIAPEMEDLGVNVIAISQGPHYGTDEDHVVVICANYDTKEDSAGVDDNGSGVAALLETARALSSLDQAYSRQNTIIYALVDNKHNSFAGSHEFVEDFLLPLLDRHNSTIKSVIVLDGLLHFDPFPSSQGTPRGFEELFPDAAHLLHEHTHMGDYIQLIGRAGTDDALLQSFSAAFARSIARLESKWSFQPWLLPLVLNMKEITTMDSLYRLQPYLFADHSSFYFHSKQKVEIPTLYVTDTLNNRGIMQYCNYCDGLYMLTEDNLRFLTLITDTIIRTIIHLSDSDASAILDELQTPNFSL